MESATLFNVNSPMFSSDENEMMLLFNQIFTDNILLDSFSQHHLLSTNENLLNMDFGLNSKNHTNSIDNNQANISSNNITNTTNNAPQMSMLLTVRLLMQGKEVGSIIGRGGDQIRKIREKSQAKINISDGSCPERIVTITGNEVTINKAFTMICDKFEEDLKQMPDSVSKPPITLRLIVPATQCGSVIGKQGSKIKEIRERTGASIQVASEMLPTSTERAVTISGSAKAITLCMGEVCKILLEAPPRGTNIPYRPKSSINPVLVAQNAAVVAAAAAASQQNGAGYSALIQQQAQNLLQQAYGTNPLIGIPNLSTIAPHIATHQFNPALVAGELTRLQPYHAAPTRIPQTSTDMSQLISSYQQPSTSSNSTSGSANIPSTVDPSQASYYLSQASLTGNPLMWQPNVSGMLTVPGGGQTLHTPTGGNVISYMGENKETDYYQGYLMSVNPYVGGLKRKASPNPPSTGGGGASSNTTTTSSTGYANGGNHKKRYSPY
uniref:K Homology domain-containing protein n=1 Tax=Strongyloides stercoralis TaxID=6248 RepID=A0A0K0DUV1_STRER